MILPQTNAAVLFLAILSLLCWGSWANTYKLAGKWRYELYYFDFAAGVILAAFVYALTVGNLGYDGFSFVDDLMHAGKRQWLYGLMGGVLFNLGNMILMSAISVAGMALAFPVGIGVATIVGIALSFAARSTGNPALLFAGCVLIAAAIVAAALAYRFHSILKHEVLARAGKAASTRRPNPSRASFWRWQAACFWFVLPAAGQGQRSRHRPRSLCRHRRFRRGRFRLHIRVQRVSDEPSRGRRTPGGAGYLQEHPIQHLLGVMGGVLWSTGMVAGLAAASAPAEARLGPVAGYLVAQGYTLIAALWGVLLWKEFKGADLRVKALAVLMFLLFAGGLLVISQASLHVRAA